MLLRAGANTEHKDNMNITASYLARENGRDEIVTVLEQEPARREVVVIQWIKENKENLARIITEVTSGQLIPDIANIITDYTTIEYMDIPLEYRLNN